MKRLLVILIVLGLSFVSILNAESDEWGAWFKFNMEQSKKNTFEPEDEDWIMNNWRNHSEDIFKTYKYYRQKLSEGRDITEEEEIDIVPAYYFDGKNTEQETNRAVEFYIYAFEHSKKWLYQLRTFRYLVKISYHGNEKAKRYIFKQKDNSSLSMSLRLRFMLATLFWGNDETTLSYLMHVINKAQDVETTNIKYSSPNESAILGAIRDTQIISRRYKKGKDYNYILPLIRQMIFSSSKGIQSSAVSSYYYYTNRNEMKKIYKNCWAKANDKNTPREEYINALYGLQALYFLEKKSLKKYKIEFKGIGGYFSKLGTYILTEGGKKFAESKSESRINEKQKEYFIQRLDH